MNQIDSFNLYQAASSLVAQSVKSLPAMWETGVQSLGQEDPLEKEMTTHSSILAWRIPWTEEPSPGATVAQELQSRGSQRVRHNWVTNTLFFHFMCQALYQVLGIQQKIRQKSEFPTSLVVRILGFHLHDPGSIPGQQNEIFQKK